MAVTASANGLVSAIPQYILGIVLDFTSLFVFSFAASVLSVIGFAVDLTECGATFQNQLARASEADLSRRTSPQVPWRAPEC